MEVIYSGWLIKSPPPESKMKRLGPFRSQWRRRFFVLYGPPAAASNQFVLGYHECIGFDYYKDDDRKERLGSIDLRTCQQVCDRLDSVYYKHLFSVITTTRTFYLAAETASEMDIWVDHLITVLGLDSGGQANPLSGAASHRPVSSSLKLSKPSTLITRIVGASFNQGDYATKAKEDSGNKTLNRQQSDSAVTALVAAHLGRVPLTTVEESLERTTIYSDSLPNDDSNDTSYRPAGNDRCVVLNSDVLSRYPSARSDKQHEYPPTARDQSQESRSNVVLPSSNHLERKDSYVDDDLYDIPPLTPTVLPSSDHLERKDDLYDIPSLTPTVLPSSDHLERKDSYVNDDLYDKPSLNSTVDNVHYSPKRSDKLHKFSSSNEDLSSSEHLEREDSDVDDDDLYDIPPPAAHGWVAEDVHSYVNAASVVRIEGVDYVIPRREVFSIQSIKSDSGVFEVYATPRTRSFRATSQRNSHDDDDSIEIRRVASKR